MGFVAMGASSDNNMRVAVKYNMGSFMSQYRQRSGYAYLVWGVSLAFVLFQFFIQLSSGEMVTGLMKSFSLSAFGGGLLASAYYFVYVALQTPAGILMDRYGPRRLLSVGALVLVIGSVLFGSTHSLALAFLGRILMGAGSGFAFVGSLSLIGRWFPPQRFAVMVGMTETIGMLGVVVGSYLLAHVIASSGWRVSVLGMAVIALIITVLITLFVQDQPSHLPVKQKTELHPIWPELKLLIKKPLAWMNGIYGGLMFAIATVFVALWGIPFLRVEHHISLVSSAMVSDMLFLGAAVGSPMWGYLDARMKSRRPVMLAAPLVSLVLLLAIIYLPNLPLALVGALMFILGVACSTYILTIVIASEIVSNHARGTSLGFLNTLTVGSAPLLQPLVGWFLGLAAGSREAHTHVYSLAQYQDALFILPVMMIIAAIMAWHLPNRKIA